LRINLYKEEVKNIIIYTLAVFAIVLSMQSCANMAQGPTGGFRDSLPPMVVNSDPKLKAVNFNEKKVEIYFDEYITLNNATKYLMISPTQKRPFIAKGIGKKVSVELIDTLLPNTTYTFDFGNSIVDYKEGNPIQNFSFCFSTGDIVDTMSISGNVLDANVLTPMPDVLVGVYSNLEDSAFTTGKLERIALTDATGRFVIHNLARKPYRIYALKDVNNNKYFDQPTESLAMLFDKIEPTMTSKEVVDTLFKNVRKATLVHSNAGTADTVFSDSMAIDTIIHRTVNLYYPDSVVLRLFKEELKQQFFDKAERKDKDKITLYFKNYEKREPKLTLLNADSKDWMIEDPSVTKDTFTYWIKDTVLANMDTLRIALEYAKYDSIQNLEIKNDTLDLVYIEPKKSRAQRKKEKQQIDFLKVSKFTSTVDIDKDAVLEWDYPVISFGKENMKLFHKIDTVWVEESFELQKKEPRSYVLKFDMKPEDEYKVDMDSASVTDIRGLHNDKTSLKFRKKPADDYSKLILNVKNAPSNSKVELLKGKDVVVKCVDVDKEGKAVFENMSPAEYSVRLFVDANGDGKWTTGKYSERLQPEEVYYYQKFLKLRANWDVEEDWDVKALPLIYQRLMLDQSKVKK